MITATTNEEVSTSSDEESELMTHVQFENFLNLLEKLFHTEDLTLWEQGDILKRFDTIQMTVAVERFKRKRGTLVTRSIVAGTFPPEERNPNQSFGVHKELVRIRKSHPEQTKEILWSAEQLTVEQANHRVRTVLASSKPTGTSDGKAPPAQEDAMFLDGIQIRGRINAAGKIELTIGAHIVNRAVTIDEGDSHSSILEMKIVRPDSQA